MVKSARVTGETSLARGRFDLTRTEIDVVEDDGAERTLAHEIYRHGKAAAVLLYDPARMVVTLVRQFRAGAFLADGALATIEACAGMLDGDEPEACVVREALEETGIAIRSPRRAFDAYMSPGGMTEKIACFVAPYGVDDRAGEGGGVDEDEYIEVIEIPFADALEMIASGAIADAKTIALLYYAKAEGNPCLAMGVLPDAAWPPGRLLRLYASLARRPLFFRRLRGGLASDPNPCPEGAARFGMLTLVLDAFDRCQESLPPANFSHGTPGAAPVADVQAGAPKRVEDGECGG